MEIINSINDILWTYLLVAVLLGAGIYFTVRLKGMQFTMIGEMFRLLVRSGHKHDDAADLGEPTTKRISSFQAFVVSLAARVGTGNIAGVAIAIVLGGPGAVFWMWVVALVGSANAFVESTLAQLFKIRGDHSYIGGPAYYIMKGIGKRWYANLFAILITVTFGFAFTSVQSNTMAIALHSSFGVSQWIVGIVCATLTLAVICGGIQRIAKINEIIVPVMAVMYIGLAVYVVLTRITMFPHIMQLIIENAFGFHQAIGGTFGMAVIMGVKRGLFSNEAGEGSTPNAAATAAVSHPAKQGFIQTLGVFVDTLFVCTATAFIILCSGVYDNGLTGIELTQFALGEEVGNAATIFVALAVIMFAFSSIIANYFFGEANLRFINPNVKLRNCFRACVGVIVFVGAVVSLDMAWAMADITMALMTLCNIIAIAILGRYAVLCLNDYRRQLKEGHDPVYHRSTIPEIADKTECWPE